MVTAHPNPQISWEENFTSTDDSRVADLILRELVKKLREPDGEIQRLFFVVPTPSPYPIALKKIRSLLGSEQAWEQNFRTIELSSGAICFILHGEQQFQRFVPVAFRLGPPELTLIAANCAFKLLSPKSELSDYVLKVIRSQTPSSDTSGMHFDSGDLIEVF